MNGSEKKELRNEFLYQLFELIKNNNLRNPEVKHANYKDVCNLLCIGYEQGQDIIGCLKNEDIIEKVSTEGNIELSENGLSAYRESYDNSIFPDLYCGNVNKTNKVREDNVVYLKSAVASFLISSISFISFIGFLVHPDLLLISSIFAITGIILGIISIALIKKYPNLYKGIGFSKAGIISGSISLLLSVLLIIAFINALRTLYH